MLQVATLLFILYLYATSDEPLLKNSKYHKTGSFPQYYQ